MWMNLPDGFEYIILSVILIAIASVPYLYYLCGIRFGKKTAKIPLLSDAELPCVSIVISAYNESAVIERRITNLLESDYPLNKYELLFIDDCSSDNTGQLAKNALEKSGIPYQFFTNTERKGTNRSYNAAIKTAKYDIIATTDANKFFRAETLRTLISRLMYTKDTAAVCAEVLPEPVSAAEKLGSLEGVYRNFYGRMCDWESAVDSTYNFNGALVAFKKDMVSSINERKGADDANTAFEAIRRGYRAVYETNAIVYEKIPGNIKKQYKQKIRRAKRLIEATLANRDLLRSGRPFAKKFYPFRLMMYVVCPAVFFAGGIFFIIGLFIFNPLIALLFLALVILFMIGFKKTLAAAFVLNQFYLLIGLLNLGKDMRVWESTSV